MIIKLTRKLHRKRGKNPDEVKRQEKVQGDLYRGELQTQFRVKQEAVELAKKEKFAAASKINRVKKGKKEKNRSHKPSKKRKEAPKEIDPEKLAFLQYLGELDEGED